MQKLLTLTLTFAILTFASCDRVKNETKSVIHKSGEMVGQATTEFFDGVARGVEETLDREVVLSDELQKKGMQIGRINVEDTASGKSNLLVVYGIFNQAFNDTLRVKIFGPDGVEIGRSRQEVNAQAGDAKYLSFVFDRRTYIEKKSKIVIE